MISEEKWLPVVGYEGLYEVSNLGRVKSLKAGPKRYGAILKPAPHKQGYPQVNLRKAGQGRSIKVHRLVGEAFLGPLPEGYVTCHEDSDTTNPRLDNLRYDTLTENIIDTVRHGHHAGANKTHCSRGHEFSGNNLRVDKRTGWRVCKTCKLITAKQRRENARENT